jgi:phosphoribosylanthranilate isomerase
LNAANVADGIARVRPWAVDVSSGVEVSKGIKSADLIHEFCRAVRRADAEPT